MTRAQAPQVLHPTAPEEGEADRTARRAPWPVTHEVVVKPAQTVDRGLDTDVVHPLSLRRAFVPSDPADLRRVLDGAYTFLRPLDRWRSRGGPSW